MHHSADMDDVEDDQKQSDAFCQTSPKKHLKMKTPTTRFRRTFFLLGVIEIVLGIAFCSLIVVMDVFTRTLYSSDGPPYYEIFGAWDGVLIFTCGIIALIAYHRPSQCVYLANLALSITIANSLLVRAVIASGNVKFISYYPLFICSLLSAAICFVGLTVFIVHFIFFCVALSCCGRRATVQVL